MLWFYKHQELMSSKKAPNTTSRTITGITLALPQSRLAPARSAGECNAPDPRTGAGVMMVRRLAVGTPCARFAVKQFSPPGQFSV